MPASISALLWRRSVGLIAVAGFAVITAAGSGRAQTAAPAVGATPPQPPAASTPRETPGQVGEIGKLLKDPSLLIPDFAKPQSSASELPAPPSAPAAAAPTPASPSPIVPAMINGRQVCPASASGAADCGAGAAILCRSKGYPGGRSLAVDATEKCSAKMLIPGRAREAGDCRTENFVTRAWCQ